MKYERPKKKFLPPEFLPNRLKVPAKTLLCISDNDAHNESVKEIIENLKTHKKRDWMTQHSYFCLPLTMGNQHGFVIKSYYDFRVFWDGGSDKNSLEIDLPHNYAPHGKQMISSHFGSGIITIQNFFALRTTENVSLLIFNAPNYFIDGIHSLTAVVETDNLRRDFTFNLKITRINEWIEIKKNQPIAAVLPYPRHFIDDFELKLAQEIIEPQIIEEERRTANYFGRERTEIDSKYAGGNGFRYMDGEDVYGIKFKNHQKKLGD